ncbi:MAG TPA: hypothetical protein DCY94_01385 [Firmicutes bacterium]|nr:hypothetical protein [Bacillota bacterium]
MKSLQEIWKELEEYLRVENALEQGFSNGKYTEVLARYAKNVTAIDVSEDFLNVAKENLKNVKNVNLMLMDAENMQFEDDSFDVLLNTSFHEFDLSGDIYKLDLDLKKRILKEMIRVSKIIIFIEPTPSAVTNELFKVFNPNENHSDRIQKSNDLIAEFMKENGYALVKEGLTYNEDVFKNQPELEEEMLNWWSDIKVPTSKQERSSMIEKIDKILDDAGMLKDLRVREEIGYRVYKRV